MQGGFLFLNIGHRCLNDHIKYFRIEALFLYYPSSNK